MDAVRSCRCKDKHNLLSGQQSAAINFPRSPYRCSRFCCPFAVPFAVPLRGRRRTALCLPPSDVLPSARPILGQPVVCPGLDFCLFFSVVLCPLPVPLSVARPTVRCPLPACCASPAYCPSPCPPLFCLSRRRSFPYRPLPAACRRAALRRTALRTPHSRPACRLSRPRFLPVLFCRPLPAGRPPARRSSASPIAVLFLTALCLPPAAVPSSDVLPSARPILVQPVVCPGLDFCLSFSAVPCLLPVLCPPLVFTCPSRRHSFPYFRPTLPRIVAGCPGCPKFRESGAISGRRELRTRIFLLYLHGGL